MYPTEDTKESNVLPLHGNSSIMVGAEPGLVNELGAPAYKPAPSPRRELLAERRSISDYRELKAGLFLKPTQCPVSLFAVIGAVHGERLTEHCISSERNSAVVTEGAPARPINLRFLSL